VRRCRSTIDSRFAPVPGRSARRSSPSGTAGGRRRARGTRGGSFREASSDVSLRWTSSDRANDKQPRGCRWSSRCTISGTPGFVAPRGRPRQGLRQRPPRRWAPGRVYDHGPRACRPRSGTRPRRATANGASASSSRSSAAGPGSTWIFSPAATRCRLGRTAPSTLTRPDSIRRWACDREPSGCASSWSSLVPASSSVTVIRIGSSAIGASELPAPRTSAITPERDRHVGDVERRPRRELDEVDHRSAGEPVDQVPDRARRPSIPVGSHSHGRSGRSTRNVTSAGRARPAVNRSTTAPPPDRKPNATASVADVDEVDQRAGTSSSRPD